MLLDKKYYTIFVGYYAKDDFITHFFTQLCPMA